jgi:hypothetical protein
LAYPPWSAPSRGKRSRIRFLTDGDANTKYFHLLSRGRKWRNTIMRIKDNSGNMCTSREEMEAAIHGHFQGVFGTPGSGAFTFDHAVVGITPLDLSALELPFTEEEVLADVRDTLSDRASGPDGFTGAFYKAAWATIKDDIMHALNALFFGDSRMFRSLNNTFIVLLPKKPDASTTGDYRPITMIHNFGKLTSKLLATRLAPRLS